MPLALLCMLIIVSVGLDDYVNVATNTKCLKKHYVMELEKQRATLVH